MMELLLNLLKGLPATVGLTIGAFAIGTVLGIPLVLMRRSSSRLLRWSARIYIDIARGIPPVVWLFIIFFGLGTEFIRLTSLQAAVIGLGLVSSAYLAEIYRGGFMSLPRGQEEAAVALGMPRLDVLRFVSAPQVLRVTIPPMATFFVSLLKDGTVASTIGVRDIMMFTSQAAQASSGGFAPFLMAATLYIVMSIPVAFFSRVMDEKLRRRISK
ncbi:amino acid ABC transporter permease [Microvirga sp. VF16]|uniref:amino acid ABC transporter permease n=1 Tax=Microvirga sp. VF16 TaxID=2807101 RepID=UPI00193EBB02|nr:amino acid ABC transporter permease [Microvirga sp. VF16]QRM32289.1 amino acid ABC transporter permease [Microvirga sp. VF16]